MTMTITLPPEVETALGGFAQRVGQEPDVFASKLLADTLAHMQQELAEDIAAVHAAMEDVRAGRERPYEDYIAERRLRYPEINSP